MPRTDGLSLFLRTGPLSPDEQLQLLETRRLLLKPHLDSILLPKLGDVECLRSEVSFTHRIAMDLPEVLEGSRGLGLRGIFGVQPWEHMLRFANTGYRASPGGVDCPDGVIRLWGLTRDAEWIVASIGFKGQEGYKGRGYEKAATLIIEQIPAFVMLEKTGTRAVDIWRALGKFAATLRQNREAAFQTADKLARIMAAEEQVFEMLQSRSR